VTAVATGTPLALRAVADGDRQLLLEVFGDTRAAELSVVPWPAEVKAAFVTQQFLAQDAAYRARWPDRRFLVVEVAGEPAGRLYLGESPGELRVVDVTLLPRFRGRGIGTALLRGVCDEAAARGLTVVLHVEHTNVAARRLYERLGLVETTRDDLHARLELRPVS
jgi:ribosomal protein S18 acetylase RimI-like enzyme